ncbi:MAG: transcription-repair coupling factor [Bacilli bacterium]|nr:transcription-repair coupling factor [Bacilli bacterium]MBQ6538647.1 transcription-repair coupling factor [Bacilli bacterium]
MDFFNNFISLEYKKDIGITGITDAFFSVYLYNLLNRENKNILVVVNSLTEANTLYSYVNNLTDDVYLFPMDDFLTSEALAVSPDLVLNRLDTLNELMLEGNKIIITNLTGYLRFLPNVDIFKKFSLNLKVGEEIDNEELKNRLYKMGYVRDSIVNKTGEVAIRGFVIDVYPLEEEKPVRIEFFGDEIESIRYFDSETQRSLEEIKEISIKPCIEFMTFDDVKEEEFNKQKYLTNYEKVNSISDYLNDGIVIYKDYEQLLLSNNDILDQIKEYREEKDKEFKGKYMFNITDIDPKNKMYYLSINNIKSEYVSDLIDYNVSTINKFNDNFDLISNFVNKYLDLDYTIVMFLKKYQINNISSRFISHVNKDINNIKKGKINFIEGYFPEGFIYDNTVILTSNELFRERIVKNKYKNKFKYSKKVIDVDKLELGDYVVHILHGIGIYNGIKTITTNGIDKDYVEILYAGKDKIYIPVERISSLYKYSGKEGMVPKINSLSGSDWIKTKNRVLGKINDMADQLLKLYAERSLRKGYSFSKDNYLMNSFEKDVGFELTKDQVKAISEIKEDMEKDSPMDRLLCGDVGFGKTEVAFVAAFKAILDSKQVLFLCPTTILSNQHYENAKERFAGYPVNIGILNRFTPPREARRIIEGLKDGSIDLVFGTHRLLSEDIKPSNLGLLIIDEEQRFGVKHKEKIKEYKTNVDVLTLSATPIPRTLQMSLVGLRNLSLIETAPINRYPIQTYVIEENDQLIKDAILKEKARGGQSFILYNRVDSIDYEKEKLQKLMPDISIAIGHGQLSKNELESTVEDFIENKYDVLLCSTIIETGIDIPNVNTLIVIDADRFGLSQLYQIRGRVGRSDRFAYAYLMYKPYKKLTEGAVKRLKVIKEFTELGSGFNIASRDLSIRGAGDILGSEQAGFIDSVGIDLYLKMLNDEVEYRREGVEKEEKEEKTTAYLDVSTHISDELVFEDELKIEIHKLIDTIDSKEQFNLVKEELEDRFGKLDESIIIYMYTKWFDKLADLLNIINVNNTRNFIEMIFPKETISKLDIEDVFVLAYKITNRFKFQARGRDVVISLNTIRIEKHPIYYLVNLLDKIYKMYKKNIDK